MGWILYLFCMILVDVCLPQHDNHVTKILTNFEDDTVRGMTQYGDTLAVALQKEIKLLKVTSFNDHPVNLGSIQLEENVFGSEPVLEFKFINEFSILICTERGCSVCEKANHAICTQIPFDIPEAVFSGISAALVDDKIQLRAVRQNGNASIYIFEPKQRGDKRSYELVRSAMDLGLMHDFTIVGAFSTTDYTYFVGSANRRDLPSLSLITDNVRNNTDIRITRICNNDKTRDLDSRIDVVLSCDGIDYGDLSKSIKNVATASLYIPQTGRLLVAFEHSYSRRSPVTMICEYDFKEIQSKFDYTWDKCQQIHNSRETRRICKKADGYNAMEEECFLYTWNLNTQQPLCEAFNDGLNLNNCDLHLSDSTNKRYGWLENFKAVVGNKIYQSPKLENFVALQESNDPHTLFALNSGNHLQRLHIYSNKSEPLLWVPAAHGQHILQIDKSNNMILFVDPRFSTTVNYVTLTCGGLYSDCNYISWSDPLECAFCTLEDGNGTVVTLRDKMACHPDNRLIRGVCPPQITRIYPSENGKYLIEGRNLTRLHEGTRKITICNDECSIEKVNDDYISCTPPHKISGCEVVYTGKLDNDHEHFVLRKSSDSSINSSSSDSSHTNSRMKVWRTIGFIIALIILLVIIFVIYLFVRRRFSMLRNKARGKHLNENSESNIERYNPVLLDVPLDSLNPSFSGNIRDDQLNIIKDIGKGNSAVVQLAYFYPNPNNKRIYQEVAVKIFYAFGHDQEAKKEIEMMNSCRHPNIVSFIGHVNGNQKTLIVTEYMKGGSVHDYLRNPENKPTIGHCYSFIKQILNGMVYLSHQHVIHRDLATRNCLLDENYEVLKISDFGLSRRTNRDYEYISLGDQKLPFKWLPIEVLKNQKKFDVKSDVWSFGVVVWELFTRATPPYENMNFHEVSDFLSKGHRLSQPEYCPDELWTIIQCCWDAQANNRPTFDSLQISILNVLETYEKANPDQMNVEYERPKSFSPTPNETFPSNGGTVMTAV